MGLPHFVQERGKRGAGLPDELRVGAWALQQREHDQAGVAVPPQFPGLVGVPENWLLEARAGQQNPAKLRVDQPIQDRLEDSLKQRLLGVEEAEDRRLMDVGSFRDGPRGGPVKTAPGELLLRGAENAGADFGGHGGGAYHGAERWK